MMSLPFISAFYGFLPDQSLLIIDWISKRFTYFGFVRVDLPEENGLLIKIVKTWLMESTTWKAEW